MTSATGALVMKFFVPFSTQPVAVLGGARALRLRVRAGLGLGQREAADLPARRQVRQPAGALGVAAVVKDRRAHQRALHRHRDRRRRAARARSPPARPRTTRASMPAPPQRSGTMTPSSPSSPSREKMSRGNLWLRSISAARGRSRASPDRARCSGSTSARETGRSSCAFPCRAGASRRTPACLLFDPRSRTGRRTDRVRPPARRPAVRPDRAACPGVTVCFAACTASGAWPAICAATARTRGISASGSATALHRPMRSASSASMIAPV